MSSNNVFLTDTDKYLFGKGTHYEIYEKLGAHITEADGRKGVARNFALVMCKAQFNSQIYREAKNEITKLGLEPSHPHKGSKADRICSIIGFENFRNSKP